MQKRKTCLFLGIILCTLTPIAFSWGFLGLSLFYILPCYFVFFSLSLFFLKKKELHLRPICAENENEVLLQNRLYTLCEKTSLPSISLKILEDDNEEIAFYSRSWPYPKEVIISKNVLVSFNKGFSQNAITALFAHELGHIKNQDPLLSVLVEYFSKILQCIFVASPLAFLCFQFIPSFLLLTSLALLMLLQEGLAKALKREKELLADKFAAKITSAESLANGIYEQYLQYLLWKKIVIENDFARAKSYQFSSPIELNGPPRASYFVLKTRVQKVTNPPAKLSNWQQIQSWFNDFPTLAEREASLGL